MGYFSLRAVTMIAVCGLVPSVVFGQGTPGFSITNYQYVSEQRISQSSSYVTYRADLVNAGAARTAVTASVSSLVSSIQVVPGEGVLHFAPVPANSTVTSLDTFTILVDRTVAFDFAGLQWTFLGPVANAGPNRTATVGSLVILDGSGSTNPSGYGTLMYNWKLVSAPQASSTVLYWYDTVKPQFTVDVAGNYVISLTVSNGGGSDTATVTVSTTNTPPVANAGANRTVSLGAVVTLNGSGSSDADGDPLTYSWTMITLPFGSSAVLLAPTSMTPVFTVDKPGSYTIRLIVNDGKVDSAPSTVTISTQNTPPVANAGPNQVLSVGALVQLDGSGSTDVDGDPLTYRWSLISVPTGSTALLSSATAVKPTFTADLPGTYVAQLTVNDGKADSVPATVQITTNPPLAPTASAGPNQTVAHRTTVHLNGSGTDPQNLPLTYQWSLTSKPALSTAGLSSTTIPNPTFVADMPGNYVAQLIVSNGILPSAPSMVTITTTNTAPVANPGLNQYVPAPASVSLDGSGSYDADGDPLTYAWSFSSWPAGSTHALSSSTAVSPTFVADVAGTYVVQLIVFDGFAYSTPATVTITAGGNTITLSPNPLNLSTNTPGSLTVSLGSLAGPGGQIVFLDSSNGTIASIQAIVTVPEGMAGVNVQVSPGSGSGSTTITALANGFTPGFAQVNVATPAITVTLSAGTIGLTRTVNGTLTLSGPAPISGVSVTLSDPAGFVTFQPPTVAFAAGATTGAFTATGAAIGSTTILAEAPGYNTGMASVTVSMLGAITLLSNVTVGPGQSVPFPVSIVTGAPVGGVTIALVSSDTSKVTILPSSVTIAQGATTPTQQPNVSGVNLGSADISASAPGFFGDTKTVQVAANLSFQPQTLTIGVNGTQDLTLNLSGPAPASGLVINISSSNPAAVTVPNSVTFAATKNSVTVAVTGIAIGTSIIHASAPALADTTATVNVVNVGTIGLPSNTTVGLGQSVAFPVTLPSPAPAGGVTVSLGSSDSSKVTISATTLTIAAGQTGPPAQPSVTGVNVGAANITASATGYTAASQAVQVTATVSFAQPSVMITGAATVNAVLNLSAAAPSGGLTIALSSSNPNVATVPPTVTFAANATTVNVPVTSVTPGSAVIHASGTNIADATTNVTVLSAGSVNVPASLSPVLGQSVTLAVSLASAPSSPVTITLVSSDPAKVSISSSTVTIPAGQTTPLIQPQVTGVNIGTATISASAPGYNSGSTAVQVSATIAFTQPSLTITGAITQNLTLTLSAAAPAGGLTINLSSSNTGVATVPLTVAFGPGATTTSVPVTGVAAGSAVIHASNLPNIADVTANVTVLILGSINLPSNPSVGLGQTIPFPVTLSAPAPSAVTVALASTDPSKVTISASSVSIAQGVAAPAQQPTITGVNIGSASINATATGYTSGSATVQVTATIAFTPPSVTLTGGGTQNLTLTLSGPAPFGLAVNLSSSNGSVGTVPSSVTFTQGYTTVLVPLTIVGSGSTVIHASNLPNLADTTCNVTVQGSISVPATISMPPGQQAPFTITLGSPAPASGVTVLLSSSDTSKVTVAGSVFITAGQTSPNATPAVNGIDFGTATVTASANGYGTASTSVQVSASASFFPPTVSVTAGAGVQNLSLVLSAQAPSGVTFTLNSSNPGVATAPVSVTIPANQNNVNVPVTPVGQGSTTITASTATPNIANTTASVTITPPGTITLPSNASVGLGKTVAFPVNLGAAAASSVTITLGSSNLSKLTISPTTVTIGAGLTQPAVQPQVTGLDIGAVTITASASGYTTASVPAQVTATISYSPASMTIVGNTPGQFVISLSGAAPASGIVLTLSSSNTAVATVPPQQTFYPDGSSISTLVIPVTAIGPGTAVIHAGVPPYIPDTTANVTVLSTGTIGLPSNVTLAPNQSVSFPVTLGTAAPTDGVNVALSSSDISKVTISPASVFIAAGQFAPSTQPTITAVNYGTANINATAPGYTAASAPVQVTATMSFASPTVTIDGITTQNVALNLSAPAPSVGLTVNLISSNTSAVAVPGSVNFPANATTVNVLLTAVAAGSATITATAVAPGIANATTSVTVVNTVTINLPASGTLGLDQSVSFPVSLSSAAVAPVTIALASDDTSRVTLSTASVTIAAGQTIPPTQPTITGVNFGAANINATASGYTPASSTVQVIASVVFTPLSLTMTGTGTQNLTLTLSAPAPPGGVIMNLISSNTSAVTVPANVSFSPSSSVVTVPVTAIAPGSATIHASSLPNIADSTASVTVQGAINLPANVTVPPGQQAPFSVTLGTPAPSGGVTVSLTSSDTSKVALVSGNIFFPEGQTTPTFTPTVNGVDFGSSTITATANGYGSANTVVQVTGSANFFPGSLTFSGTGTQNLSLTLSVPAPSSVTFTLNSSSTGVATVPPSVTIPANQNSVTVPVTAVGPGSTTITASTTTPNIANATAGVTVTAPGVITVPVNLAVGLSTSVDFPVTLGTPAPAGGATVTLASSDTTKLSISPGTVDITAGQSTPAIQPKVTGIDIGALTITASAPGYTSAVEPEQVTATVSYAPTSLTIVGTASQSFTLTLSGAAPPSGIIVTLTSSNTGVATVPQQLTFLPNGGSPSTLVVPVTGVTPGNAVIHVAAMPYIPDTTANVTVLPPGAIGLPSNVSVGPTLSVPFPVTLGTPAPTEGVTVTLASGDTSKLTISPLTVDIAGGDSSPATQPTVTGVNYGTVNITASAPGYVSASAPVKVTAIMTFASPTVTMTGITTQNVALNLSAPAPAVGLTVNLNSSNPSVATVPPSVVFPPNAATMNVLVTSVSAGPTTITATAVASTIANATTNVTVLSPGAIVLPTSATVGLGQTATLVVALSQAPASNVTVALASGDTSKVTISPSSVTIPANQTTPGTQPTITGVNLGTANITATSLGYTSGTTAVQVNATVSFPQNLTVILGTGAHNLTLNLSAAAPASGITVNLTSSNPSAATVPPTVTFTQGLTTIPVPVTAVGLGVAVIHAANLPNIADATANVTVAAPATVNLPASPTVGLGASAAFTVSLASPAPVDLTIALASSDTSKVTISPSSVTIPANQTTPGTQPTINGVNLGSANITATGTGVTTASVVVQVNATITFAPPTVTITGIATQTVALNLSGAAPASGLTINLVSSAPSVATVPASVSFAAGATSVNVLVTAVGLGSTTITASTTAPNVPNTTVGVTVVTAGLIGLPVNPTVGLGKTATFAVTLPQAAAADVTVTLSSTDTNTLTISPSSVTIPAGQTTPTAQPTITGVKLGTATINASAPGYTSSSVPVQVNATVSFPLGTLTISGFNTQNLTLTLSAAAPAGGVIINLSSGTPATATVPSTVTFIQGATTVNVPVTGVAFGTTVIHASATPNIADATANVTVQSAGVIAVPASMSVGLGQSGTFTITLPAPAAAPVTVTVSSSDTSKVLVSAGPFTIAQNATAPTTQPLVTGVNIGSVTITASAPGYTSSTGTVQTTAVVTFAQPTVTITGIGTQNVVLNLSAPAPASGLIVNLSSATPGVATVPLTVTFPALATSVNVPVTSVSLGTAVIHASATPFIADATTTVTVLSGGNVVVPASSTLAMGASATPLVVSLSAAAPAALTVTLASSDNTLVTVSPATVSIAKGDTTPGTQPTIFGVKIGTANVTASAPGYVTGTTAVQVNATVSFTPPTVTITGPTTQNLTLTLSAAAPPTGLTVYTSSSNPAVATTPATVTFTAGLTTVNVPVTALTLGSTVIHASATTFIPDATANVTVVTGGPIGLPVPVTIGLGGSAPFTVTLPVASANAVTVTLTSADPTKVTVTPATVSIAASQTTPTTQPVVHGINVGSAISVSASAPGYTTASQTVTVGATVSWPSPTFTFTTLGVQNVTLTLSATAPTGGLSVNLTSSNQLVATVPATATFAAGSNTALVAVNALLDGSTVLHASGVNIPDSNATLTVAIPTLGVFTVSSITVGQNLQAQLTINLSTQVQGFPLQVTVTSSDGSKLVLGSLTVAGTVAPILQFGVGTNSGIVYAQALAGSGTVTVTASSPGYTSGSGTVTLTPSGFVMTGPAGVVGVASFPSNVGNTTPLTVMTGRLDPSLVYQETQGLRGGFSVTVPLSSSNGTVGKVSPASLNFTSADTAYTTTFTALTVGATTLSTTTPTGFSTPANGANGITANIAGGAVSAPNVTVGQSLEVAAQVTLAGAPSTATVITLTSSDPSRLRFGISATDAGAGTIPIPGCVPPAPDPTNACKIITVGASQGHTPDIYFQALDSTGSATYTATLPVFGTGTGTVTFRPSSILIAGPFGLGNSISTTTGSAAVDLTIESAMLVDATPTYLVQPVAASPVSVNVTSSNMVVGTITVSPVTIPAGSAGATSGFLPGSSGSSTLSVDKPTGFSPPAAYGSVVASVSVSGIAITQGVSIGKFLQIQGYFTLGAPAPAGLVVTFQSPNPSVLLLSTSPTAAGAATIGVTMTAGGFNGVYYIQALADTGTVTYTASAPGYASNTGTITLTKSGVVVGDGSGAMLWGNSATVSMAQLDAGNVFGQIEQLAGGLSPVSIAMATDVPGATITSPVTISAGADTASVPLTGSGYGHVTATTPPGFTDSNVLSVLIYF
jgi:uncharacterized protein YjdB